MRKHIFCWGSMFPPEEACSLMRKQVSSWRSKFPHDSLWGSRISSEDARFVMRKQHSSWGRRIPEEVAFLMRNYDSSWGSRIPHQHADFLMRKHVFSQGRTFPLEEACFLMRIKRIPQYFTLFNVFSTIPIASSDTIFCLIVPPAFRKLSWRIYTPESDVSIILNRSKTNSFPDSSC